MLGQEHRPGAIAWHPEYPQPDTLDGWAMNLAAHEAMGLVESPKWWVHQIVIGGAVPDGGLVVGDIGFHGPPAVAGAQVVEIGYNVVPACQRRGLATRACALIVERAWLDGADEVIARTEPKNVASQQVLRRNGFRAGDDGIFRIERPQ
jgi:RimJ/RimL family protein N-acetyltransferase